MLPTDQEILCYLLGYLCEQEEEEDSDYFKAISSNLYVLGAISTVVGAAVAGQYAYEYFNGYEQEQVVDTCETASEQPTPNSKPVTKSKQGPKRQAKHN